MNRFISICMFVFTCSACLIASTSAAEMRGLWVDAWNPGFKSPAETTLMVAKAKECNFNALFVQVRRRGDVYYGSGIEPVASDGAADYDALADVITKAHAVGIEVHAWVPFLEVYHDVAENTADGTRVHVRHPEWLMKDDRGRTRFPGDKLFLDPGVPEVKAYLAGIIREIVAGYQVDGVHIDIARYPCGESGYNETSVSRFNQDAARTGTPRSEDEAWSTWRRAQITDLVRQAYNAATQADPAVKVSAAVFANMDDAFSDKFQDWRSWLRDGILDFAVPMVFPKDTQVFRQTAQACLAAGTNRPVYIGQGGYRMMSAQGLQQIAAARELGAQGIVVYSYAQCVLPRTGDSICLMDALKNNAFSQPDTIPVLSWK